MKARIFEAHISVTTLGRSGEQQLRGRQCVDQLAYIFRTPMYDERTGTLYKPKKKPHEGMLSGMVGWPGGTPESLGNGMEKGETDLANKPQKAQTAYSCDVALARELNRQQQYTLLLALALWIHEKTGAPVAFVLHYDRAGNPHAHLVWAQRPYDQATGKWGKKYTFFNPFRKGTGLVEMRAEFARLTNEALVQAGHSNVRMEHESLERRGVQRSAQKHEGERVQAIARKTGKKTKTQVRNDLLRKQKAREEALLADESTAPLVKTEPVKPAAPAKVLPPAPTPKPITKPTLAVETVLDASKFFIHPAPVPVELLPVEKPLPQSLMAKTKPKSVLKPIKTKEEIQEEQYHERAFHMLMNHEFDDLANDIVAAAYEHAKAHGIELRDLDQARHDFHEWRETKEQGQRRRLQQQRQK